MKPSFVLAAGVLILGIAYAQPPSALKAFFDSRLADRQDAAPPPYESLLRVVDSIGAANAAEIQAALPSIRAGLKSNVPNVPVEGVFALFAIARRPDGGRLLLEHLPEIASLTGQADERISGGAVRILKVLTGSIPDATVPLLLERLRSAGAPSLVKSEIVRALLESSKRTDQAVLRSVDAYLALDSEPKVRIATLEALAASRVKTPAIASYALSGLQVKDKYVQIASIQAVYALGTEVNDQARPALTQLVNDRTADAEVRAMAEKALQNRLSEPGKVELPVPVQRKGN